MLKRIAIIIGKQFPIPPVNGGAIEQLLYNLIKENELHDDFKLIVYSPYNKEAESISLSLKNSKIIYIKTDKFHARVKDIIGGVINRICKRFYYFGNTYINKISKDLKNYSPDIIIVPNIAIYTIKLKKKFSTVPIILHYHNIPKPLPTNFLNRKVLLSINHFWGISKFICNEINKYGNKYGIPTNSSIFYNCFDSNDPLYDTPITEVQKKIIAHKYKLNLNNKFIIYAGRVQPYKGVKELIEAFIATSLSNYNLIIAGSSFFKGSKDDNYMISIKELCKNNNNIIFTGYIKHSELLLLYHLSNFAVIPSLWEEPFALTCLEPMACAKPVIISDSGGMIEVPDKESSIIVKRNADFIPNLTLAINKLAKDEKLCIKMGKAAYNRSRLFTSDIYYKQFKNLINNE